MLAPAARHSLAFLAARRGRETTADDVVQALPAECSDALAELVQAGLVAVAMTDSLEVGQMFSYTVCADEDELAFALLDLPRPGRRQRLSPLAACP